MLMTRTSATKNQVRIIIAVASLALVGAVVAGAAATPDPHELGGVPHLAVAAKSAFGVFDQASDPTQLEKIAPYVDERQALDPNSVHLAQSTSTFEVRVAGDAESVCLAGRQPGVADVSGCSPVANAAAAGTPIILAGWAPEGKLFATALFPNGTVDVSLATSDGTSVPVPIVNNTIGVIADASDKIHWTGPDGKTYSQPIPH